MKSTAKTAVGASEQVTKNMALVRRAVDASMLNPNQATVRTLWSGNYIQHSPLQPAGLQPILDWVGYMEKNGKGEFNYELHRMFAEGDLVALHGKVKGLGPQPSVLFNIFRIEDGRLAEHWEGIQPLVSPTASGRSMLDGPTQPTDFHLTAANKAMVTAFMNRVLIGGDFSVVGQYFDGNTYLQHNPGVPDGLSGLNSALKAMAAKGTTMRYTEVHRTIGMGNFVLTHSEGTLGGKPYQYFDLFRVENGKIAEHWDCMQDLTAGSKNNNGIF
ncbi:MAG: nuclear transport factor 2 family protein [Myxococcota bacterium]